MDDRTSVAAGDDTERARNAGDALSGIIESLRRDAAYRLSKLPAFEASGEPRKIRLAAVYEGYAEAATQVARQLAPIAEQLTHAQQETQRSTPVAPSAPT